MNEPKDAESDSEAKHQIVVVIIGAARPVPLVVSIVARSGQVVLADARKGIVDAYKHEDCPREVATAQEYVEQRCN